MQTVELPAYTPAKLAAELKSSLAAVTASLAAGQVPDAEHFVVIHGNTAALQEWADLNAAETFPAPDFDGDRFNANQDRGTKPGEWPCPVCGLGTKLEAARWVHMQASTGDYWNVNLSDSATEHDTQGWFAVGAACAKRFPAAFVTKTASLPTAH